MTKELKGGDAGVFKYDQLDGKMAEFLRNKETNMRDIVGKAYTELGRELTEAQEKLAGSRYDGVFIKWINHIGMSVQQVYRLIGRYAALTNCESKEQRDLLEDMPVSLAYSITSPSAESTPAKSQAKAEVLAGDIDTGKAYKDRIAELESIAEKEKQRADKSDQLTEIERRERERLEIENEELANKKPETVVKVEKETEYVEIDNTPDAGGLWSVSIIS